MLKIIRKDLDHQERLIYKSATNEFIALAEKNTDITLNFIYLYLGFDSETRLSTQFWGYHNDFSWIKESLIPPQAVEGQLFLQEEELEGGDSCRIAEAYDWDTYFDEQSGWIKIGNQVSDNNLTYVEFFKDTIAGLDDDGQIREFWLKPEFQ